MLCYNSINLYHRLNTIIDLNFSITTSQSHKLGQSSEMLCKNSYYQKTLFKTSCLNFILINCLYTEKEDCPILLLLFSAIKATDKKNWETG